MSDTANSPAPVLPLFFRRVVGVNPQLHGNLRLNKQAGYAFAASAQSVPVALTEFEAAAQHYPIVFTTGPNPVPVALRTSSQVCVGPRTSC